MMEECEFCSWMKSRRNLLFEDPLVAVVAPPKPASPGHVIVLPREHVTIVEQLSEAQSAQLGIMANKLSILQFETLQAVGTNLLLQNGTAAGQTMPHVGMHVIPRYDGDALSFSWKSKPLAEEQMASVEMALKSALAENDAPQAQSPAQAAKPAAQKKPAVTDAMLRSLERIP